MPKSFIIIIVINETFGRQKLQNAQQKIVTLRTEEVRVYEAPERASLKNSFFLWREKAWRLKTVPKNLIIVLRADEAP